MYVLVLRKNIKSMVVRAQAQVVLAKVAHVNVMQGIIEMETLVISVATDNIRVHSVKVLVKPVLLVKSIIQITQERKI